MYERAVEEKPCTLFNVHDWCKTQKMCERAFEKYSYALQLVSDKYRTQDM